MAILRPMQLEPLSGKAHEIPEPPGLVIEGVPEESQIRACQSLDGLVPPAQFLQDYRENKCPGVVIGAVGFFVIGEVVDGVLENPGVITHCEKVIELDFWR